MLLCPRFAMQDLRINRYGNVVTINQIVDNRFGNPRIFCILSSTEIPP